jgi:hypothetical protein
VNLIFLPKNSFVAQWVTRIPKNCCKVREFQTIDVLMSWKLKCKGMLPIGNISLSSVNLDQSPPLQLGEPTMTINKPKNHSTLASHQPAAFTSEQSPPEPCSALFAKEDEQLSYCESVITKGLETFSEVGAALLTIREQRLFCPRYATFEAYCKERWGFGRTYAWRVMGAAERLKLLSPAESQKPSSEFQMRPFLKLKPEEFPVAWRKVLDNAQDGKVTSKLIGTLISTYIGERQKSKRRPEPRKVTLLGPEVAEILILLHSIKRRVEANQGEQALPSLERIEQLLFER